MNVLLLNLSEKQSVWIKNSLSPYAVEVEQLPVEAQLAEAAGLLAADKFQLVIFEAFLPLAVYTELLGRSNNSRYATRFLVILPDSMRNLSLAYIRAGASGVILQQALNEETLVEKVLPVFAELTRQQNFTRHDRLTYISRAIHYFSHEIKNPLTNIDLSSAELRDEIPRNNPLASKFLYFIEKNCRRINEMLTESVLLMEFPEPAVRILQLETLFEEISASNEKGLAKKGISLKTDSQSITLSADKKFLVQVLNQLVKNAIEACSNSGGRIVLSAVRKKRSVLICVLDNGHGISADHLPLVMDPFYTVGGRTRGLGLAMVAELVRQHGGNITLESKPGVQTCINILLSDPASPASR